ncbi:nucleotide exchange factor GrpE [Pseudidiomarina taiwanensis]|uniref:Protein GrpE n=1 Tax=Pseudidiomarina taiwanensis TaxID=337250 RepID=A0A432ZJZ1_9GAMM|nr:nucleotide exchange factor GrpE [Pseudidiomarina taiwanensis]RUO78233.1 nucleotide exchange factor GrpE [Pseudidiomarina taiwanensis]
MSSSDTEKQNPETQDVEQVESEVEQVEQVETETVAENPEQDLQLERIAELELALQQAEQAREDANDRAVRAVAEMENVRRRAAADVEKAHKFALEKFAGELLTSVDNLERALEIAGQNETLDANFLEGIELTHKTLLSTLNKFAVEAVGEVGEPFNPELHQAMSMQANPELENNTIMAVMQKGYTLSGRLLRPAMVMVVKN